MNLVLKSQKKEPPFFRGDSSDKFSLSELEGLRRAYLGRSGYTGQECVDELVGRLVDRARDVVRTWLRSNSHVFDSGGVEAVFVVLRQHFDSVVRSDMPKSVTRNLRCGVPTTLLSHIVDCIICVFCVLALATHDFNVRVGL